jgi:hypothetical protein
VRASTVKRKVAKKQRSKEDKNGAFASTYLQTILDIAGVLDMQKITAFLWFDTEGAMKFYIAIFKMKAMMQMRKLDIEVLRRAYAQEEK